MPEIYMDVDTALSEVPVNIMPLIDDTDFKTVEDAIAYNASGMDLRWNFVTSAGAFTSTPVTPTTSGTYDWTHQGDGIYTIEIPASGGASINNDTEGYGWFSGKITGVLPFRGPIIGFRAAALNDALCDGGDLLDVNVTQQLGVAVINYDFTVSAVASTTITFPSTDAAGNSISDNGQFAHAILYCVGGTGAGNAIQLGEKHPTDTRKYNLGFGQTQLFDNTSQVVVLNINGNVNVTHWQNATIATPNTAGIPKADATHIAGTSQTGADVGAATAAAAIAAAVWNALTASYGTANTYGAMLETDHAYAVANNSLLTYLNAILPSLFVASGTIGDTGNDTTHLHLLGQAYANDAINDHALVIQDVSTGLIYTTWIEDFVAATDLATVQTLPFTPETNVDLYWVLSIRRDIFTATVKNAIATSLLDLADGVETSVTMRQALHRMLASGVGKTTISGDIITFYAADGTTPVFTATISGVTPVGERTIAIS